MSADLQWPGRDARLTQRESELLALLPAGMTNRELGEHLYLSENMIKTQVGQAITGNPAQVLGAIQQTASSGS